ncbi:hypothetical protein GALL_392660 [mine drainage metagenome]|uniref:Uncharacterized protein n=1 Tax=mine drainage metagenome TaxID=410659 RepID=A0A1J5Q5T8_9ZZZZ
MVDRRGTGAAAAARAASAEGEVAVGVDGRVGDVDALVTQALDVGEQLRLRAGGCARRGAGGACRGAAGVLQGGHLGPVG